MPGHDLLSVRFRLNGKDCAVEVPANLPLISLLRDVCTTTGTKLSCARGVCGSCTVLIDGVPGASCSLFAFHADGAELTTIEGLAADGQLHPIQEAFARKSAFQCGYCTGGMILLTKALLDRNPNPDSAEVAEWISSNVCRCTGYSLIVEAVLDAAAQMRKAAAHA